MDQRERMFDPLAAIKAAMDGNQSTIWTALPGIIVSFDPDAMTATVQPAINGVKINKDGSNTAITMPPCPDAIVIFPGGGGVTLTFPVKQRDECLLVFASRSIDGWWQNGGQAAQVEGRMHDLSDAFALVGVRSRPRKLSPGVSTSVAALRSDDGSTYVELDPEAQTLHLAAPGGGTIDANTTINGNLTVVGDFSASGNVTLGGSGGPAVARVGDTVSTGGTITSGSSKVKAT